MRIAGSWRAITARHSVFERSGDRFAAKKRVKTRLYSPCVLIQSEPKGSSTVHPAGGERRTIELGRVRTQLIHQVIAAARRISDRKMSARLSYRVAIRRKSLRRQNIHSMTLRPL